MRSSHRAELEVHLHPRQRARRYVTFTGTTHRELPKALAEIGDDCENKVLVITGTGETFMDSIDGDSLRLETSRDIPFYFPRPPMPHQASQPPV